MICSYEQLVQRIGNGDGLLVVLPERRSVSGGWGEGTSVPPDTAAV